MKTVLAIAAGGALGALGRHYLAYHVNALIGHGFPWGILACNVLGSFAMGVLVELSALVWSPSVEMRAFLAVGILGAFTTFSTFSLDIVLLLQRGDMLKAGLYVTASVLCGVIGLFAGLQLIRTVMA
ncbi:fluoride efflux transporter CrcB [Hwanghaeella sp.]|uniref:fluoride efflux transporter CrcB n=1 Tax=Hwanghaeella sp. TaxID=2605943 RepID=UPI003CCB8C48